MCVQLSGKTQFDVNVILYEGSLPVRVRILLSYNVVSIYLFNQFMVSSPYWIVVQWFSSRYTYIYFNANFEIHLVLVKLLLF